MRCLPLLLALAALAGCGDVPESRRADEGSGVDLLERRAEPGTTDAGARFRASCAALLDDLPVASDIELSTTLGETTVESHALGLDECADLSWVRGFVSTAALVEPAWAGPERTTEWDCSHSSVEYAAYRRLDGAWEYVEGALAYGVLSEDGQCRYYVANFPRQSGADSALVLASEDGAEPTEVRVGVRAWSHNDPALGHSGGDCDQMSCYWPVRLSWETH